MEPSAASESVASTCGPRPFSSTSSETVMVPSGKVVVTQVPLFRVIEITTRLTMVGAAVGLALVEVEGAAVLEATTGCSGGAGAPAQATKTEARDATGRSERWCMAAAA